MLPPIKYKIHPKMAQILEQKRKRSFILMEARLKEHQQRQILAKGRKQYIQQNKRIIQQKVQQIFDKKVIKHNKIRQQDKERSAKILVKRSQLLMRMIPQRRQFLQNIKQQYLQAIRTKDRIKQQKIKRIIQQRIIQPEQICIQQKVRQNNLIDTNEGLCVICLTSEAHLYMIQCRHLISCKDCQFILRMQKKCPLCRRKSEYSDLKTQKKHRKIMKK